MQQFARSQSMWQACHMPNIEPAFKSAADPDRDYASDTREVSFKS